MSKSLKINAFLFFITYIISISVIKAQYINVDTSYNAQQLVDKFIGINNSCITISNVSVSGADAASGIISYGYFDKGTSNFSIDDGIILSTGKAVEAIGPNNSLQSNYSSNWLGDPDLIDMLTEYNLPTSNIKNATVLEFYFTTSASTKISFDYMFLSEEYRSNNCDYSDVFAFLIKKAGSATPFQNIALVPGTNIPVTSTTINGADDCKKNIDYFGGFNGINTPTNFNGQTKLLKAVADVVPGELYHIKLVIADQGDIRGLYDSAVFLKAGSFLGNKDLGPDQKICFGSSYTIDATTTNAVKYTWYKDGIIVKSGLFPTLNVDYNDPGLYEVEIDLSTGCRLKGQIKIEQQALAIINPTKTVSFCDDDLDNYISIKPYIPAIITNYATYTSSFDVRFFDTLPGNINNPGVGINLDSYLFLGNSKTLYVWVKSGNCAPIIEPINFVKNGLSPYNTIGAIDICDNLLESNVAINLSDYTTLLNSNIVNGSTSYYLTEIDAKKQQNAISSNQTISSNKTFYVRFQEGILCENVAPISFNLKSPKKSIILKDKIICQNTTTDLDAGSGFDSYNWSTGNTSADVQNLPKGDYWVDLGFNGCIYRQYVKITEAEPAKIIAIDITGSTVSIKVDAGSEPYTFALDNANYQTSNIFTDVKIGQHTIYVKYGNDCGPVAMVFTLFQPLNVITPNGDGHNDVIDYSDLTTKTDARFQVIDRYGRKLFDSNTKKSFIWDGKYNGTTLPTSSYWYILDWKEFGATTPIQKTGWILLKNRN